MAKIPEMGERSPWNGSFGERLSSAAILFSCSSVGGLRNGALEGVCRCLPLVEAHDLYPVAVFSLDRELVGTQELQRPRKAEGFGAA
jgi:hypothetical protein